MSQANFSEAYKMPRAKLSTIAMRKPKRVRALNYKPKCVVIKGSAAEDMLKGMPQS